MPRAPKLKLSPGQIAEYALKYHVDQIQYSKTDGVTRVRHIQFGWMPIEHYYRLAKLHDALPFLQKVVEGGYRLKQALWSIDISFGVLASGTEVPLALGFVAGALALSKIHEVQGRPDLAVLDVAALALPFGELYLIWQGAVTFGQLKGPTNTAIDAIDAIKDRLVMTPEQRAELDALIVLARRTQGGILGLLGLFG